MANNCKGHIRVSTQNEYNLYVVIYLRSVGEMCNPRCLHIQRRRRCLSSIFQVPVPLHIRSAHPRPCASSHHHRTLYPRKGIKCACTLPLNHPPSSILAEHRRLRYYSITGTSPPSRPIARPAYPSHPLCFSEKQSGSYRASRVLDPAARPDARPQLRGTVHRRVG